MKKNFKPISVVMLGASGAVGQQVLSTILQLSQVKKITLLGRRTIENLTDQRIVQHKIDIFNPDSYLEFLPNHEVAICTLGVGQPSKISRDQFLKIDKIAVEDFAKSCKRSGVLHFELLSSVGIDSSSSNFFLRTKGELVDELKAQNFERLSIFQPSMILTPTNRYGFSQAVTLAIWPWLSKLFFGSLKKYRGIKVEKLGESMAKNIFNNHPEKSNVELLTWNDFNHINKQPLFKT
ncbi:MAG: NAD(P)H-binding protein [Saprospiraceae bacterium]